MNESFIKTIVKRKSRRRVLKILAAMIFCALVFCAEADVLSTLFSPLSTIQNAADTNTLLQQKKVYANLEKADVYLTDYGVYTTKTRKGKQVSEKLTSVFGAVKYKDGFVLTCLPASYDDMSEAELGSVSAICKVEKLGKEDYYDDAYDELITELMSSTDMSREEVESHVPKLCLKIEENGRGADQFFVIVLTSALAVLAVSLILTFLVLLDYKKSKLYRGLNKFGNSEEAEDAINRSIENGNFIFKNEKGSASSLGVITPEYVASSKAALPTSDLIWAYTSVTTRKIKHISVGRTYCVLLYFKGTKKPLRISFYSKEGADDLVSKISDNLPVMCGYSDDLAKTYKSKYQEFLNMADIYRNEYVTNKSQNEQDIVY